MKKVAVVILNYNGKDFLEKFPQIDVTKQEVLIPIVVEFKNIGVTVNIPDWMIHDVTPDYGNN